MRRALLLALLLIATAAIGCGESKEEKFDKEFRSLNGKIVSLGEDVGRATQGASSKSNVQIEREFGGLARRTGALQQDVDELEPPNDQLEQQQADLVEAMGDAQDAIEGIEKAADENDAQGARSSAVELGEASVELRTARRKLARETGASD